MAKNLLIASDNPFYDAIQKLADAGEDQLNRNKNLDYLKGEGPTEKIDTGYYDVDGYSVLCGHYITAIIKEDAIGTMGLVAFDEGSQDFVNVNAGGRTPLRLLDTFKILVGHEKDHAKKLLERHNF